jgi:hypothetical protein
VATTAIQNSPAVVNQNPVNASRGFGLTHGEIGARIRVRFGGSHGFGARPPR